MFFRIAIGKNCESLAFQEKEDVLLYPEPLAFLLFYKIGVSMEAREFEDKYVYVILKNKRQYYGKVISVSDNFIKLNDKFGDLVMFSIDEISFIEEQDSRGSIK